MKSNFFHAIEQRVHRPTQCTCALTVHDAHVVDAPVAASLKIIGQKRLQFAWLKRVQVKRAVNGNFNCFSNKWLVFIFHTSEHTRFLSE